MDTEGAVPRSSISFESLHRVSFSVTADDPTRRAINYVVYVANTTAAEAVAEAQTRLEPGMRLIFPFKFAINRSSPSAEKIIVSAELLSVIPVDSVPVGEPILVPDLERSFLSMSPESQRIMKAAFEKFSPHRPN
jgi:hypothetical protein